MTQEEKAKAYDEALTIAKRIISKNCSEVEKLCLKSIFPELAESEDEKMINELQGFLDSFGADYFGTGEWQKFHDWLEKQKEQKPAWSEEDEEHLKSIISTIKMCMRDCEDANAVLGYYDSDISWLKSLSPSWKPSEEQMEALERTIKLANFGCGEDRRKALVSLHAELKKLI